MGLLAVDYADRVEQVLGSAVAETLTVQAEPARGFVELAVSQFAVGGKPAGLALSADDPIIDLGGRIRNEAFLATPLSAVAGTPAGVAVQNAVGFPLGAESRAVLYVHRAVDPGVTSSRGLGTSTFLGAYVVAVSPSGDNARSAILDTAGVRVLPQQPALPDPEPLRRWFQRRTPPRDGRFDVDLQHVYRARGGTLERVRVAGATAVQVPNQLSDGLVFGASTQTLRLARAAEPVSPDVPEPPLTPIVRGSGTYLSILSGLRTDNGGSGSPGPGGPVAGGANPPPTPDAVIGMSLPPALIDTAPPGLVWGDPGATTLCSRASQDGCLGCCQSIAGRYYTSALAAVSAGAVASLGAVAGIVTVPVAWAPVAVGGVVGGLVALAGFIHGSICEKNCRSLYNRTTGEEIRTQRLQLTAALTDQSGDRVGYRLVSTTSAGTSATSTIPATQLLTLVWGGARIEITDPSGDPAFLSLARRPGGAGYYLRSYRDRRLSNNFRQLPEIPA